MTHDFYRPISQCKLAAGLDESGKLVGLHVRVSGQSINALVNPAAVAGGKDHRQLQGYYEKPGDAQLGYTVPNLLVEYAMRNTHVPVGTVARRQHQPERRVHGVLHGRGRAGRRRDPYEFRRALMQKHPKHLAVLDAAAGEGRLGQAAAGGRASRHRAVHGLRQLLGGGGRGFGEPGRPGEGASHGARARLRACRQSRPDRRAGRRLGRLRPERDVLRRVHRRGTGRMVELNFHTTRSCGSRRCRRSKR